MKLIINGQERDIDAPSLEPTLAQVLAVVLGEPRRGVAVALEDRVIPRGNWDQVEVPVGARLEIIGAVQGG